ncbi:MAG: hypothetical protein ABIA11_01090 [Patescibacteria group bacterium]
MKVKLNVEYDLDMDLHCYDYIFLEEDGGVYSYGREDEIKEFLEELPKEIGNIVRGKGSRKEKISKLRKFLEKQYKEKGELFRGNARKLQHKWKSSGDQIIYILEDFYDKEFPYNEVTAYITTNSVCPYNPEQRYFYVRWTNFSSQLSTANHELNHFMFHHYYGYLEKKMGDEKWNILKESMTFFTEPNSSGYPAEKELREMYLSKRWKDVDEIIEAGKEILS